MIMVEYNRKTVFMKLSKNFFAIIYFRAQAFRNLCIIITFDKEFNQNGSKNLEINENGPNSGKNAISSNQVKDKT